MLNNLEVGGIDRFILNLGWADCGLDYWSVDWGDKEGYRQLRQLRDNYFLWKKCELSWVGCWLAASIRLSAGKNLGVSYMMEKNKNKKKARVNKTLYI